MASHQDFTLLPTPINPAPSPPYTSYTTLYNQIFDHLNAEITSARLLASRYRTHYREWCSVAATSLSEFAASHPAVETVRASAYLAYHQGNMQEAVRDAEREERAKRVQLSRFLHWCNTPANGVCENMLMGYLQNAQFFLDGSQVHGES